MSVKEHIENLKSQVTSYDLTGNGNLKVAKALKESLDIIESLYPKPLSEREKIDQVMYLCFAFSDETRTVVQPKDYAFIMYSERFEAWTTRSGIILHSPHLIMSVPLTTIKDMVV